MKFIIINIFCTLPKTHNLIPLLKHANFSLFDLLFTVLVLLVFSMNKTPPNSEGCLYFSCLLLPILRKFTHPKVVGSIPTLEYWKYFKIQIQHCFSINDCKYNLKSCFCIFKCLFILLMLEVNSWLWIKTVQVSFVLLKFQHKKRNVTED